MNNLVPMVVVPAVIYGIYSIFELYARRKERMAIIEKLSEGIDPSLLANQLGMMKKTITIENKSAWTIRIGFLLLGIGLGIVIVALIDLSTAQISIQEYVQLNADNENARYQINNSPIRQAMSTLYPASAALFGGIGLIIAFFTERKYKIKDEK